MKEIRFMYRFTVLTIVSCMLFGFASCCNNDDDGGDNNSTPNTTNGLYGWYMSNVAQASDFDKINTAIASHELLTSYNYDGEEHNYYATRDLFIDDNGKYSDSEAHFGKLRNSINSQCHAIQIVDDNTIKVYDASLYVDGKGTGDVVCKIYAGSVFGYMTYYGTPTYTTYTRKDDKLLLLDGTIYTITTNGLVMDGSSEIMKKSDQSNVEPEGGNNNNADNNDNGTEGGNGNNADNTNPTPGTVNSHEGVDLGLSVKWATCNVGASSPSDYGDYFAWGETKPKDKYTEVNNVTNNKELGDISGNLQYDAARANWGGSWRMPSKTEFEELLSKCTWTWTTQGGHNGYKVTGSNGNSIFLPAAGYRNGSSLDSAGSSGYYWSSTPNESSTQSAFSLYFNSGNHFVFWDYRDYGRTVRPVSE